MPSGKPSLLGRERFDREEFLPISSLFVNIFYVYGFDETSMTFCRMRMVLPPQIFLI
jgi:hypothetical protein